MDTTIANYEEHLELARGNADKGLIREPNWQAWEYQDTDDGSDDEVDNTNPSSQRGGVDLSASGGFAETFSRPS
jgi:hypothetical protein